MSGSEVRLRLFGAPTLVRRGTSVVLPFERRSQLVLLLALERGWVGRAEVAARLWPEQPTKLAYTNLRKTLFRLDAVPWGTCVRTEGGALRFDGDTDIAEFETALAEDRPQEALALRRGELGAGFEDDANESWTTWLADARERLRVAWRAAALAWLARAQADESRAQSAAPQGLALTAQLLQADPLDEEALRVHMDWLVRSGQKAEARKAHDQFVQRLTSELGLEPSAALIQLGQALASTQSVPAAAPADAAAAPDETADETFIGRGAELRSIGELLAQPQCRLISLLGPGGVGKTRLAQRLLRLQVGEYADGAAFVPLEGVAGESGLGDAIARALALRLQGNADSLTAVIAALGGRQMLLVLDNFEDLVPTPAPLKRLLEQCPALKVVVTSRVRLALVEEWNLVVSGLPGPDDEDLDRIEAFDAVRLFARRARRVAPGFSLDTQAAAIAEICHLVDGLPLALELAASWTRLLSCAEIAAELRAGTDLLQAEDPSQPRRHASIEHVFEQSWQRLVKVERESLARLAVFRGGFTAEAARAVAHASAPVLGALADKSLLIKDEARLRLHPLVRQLAQVRIDPAGLSESQRRHSAFFLRLMTQLRGTVGLGNRQALEVMDLEIENCRVAWNHAASGAEASHGGVGEDGSFSRSQARDLAAAVRVLMHYCDHRGRWREGVELTRAASESHAAQRHRSVRAVALASCAHLLYRLDRGVESEATARAALALIGDEPEPDAHVQALNTLAGIHLRRMQLDEAATHYEQAVIVATEAGDVHHVAGLLGNLALTDKRAGRYAAARERTFAALQEYRRMGDAPNQALGLNNLADLQITLGDFDGAQLSLAEAVALSERQGLRWTLALALVNRSELAYRKGEFDAAENDGRRGLLLFDQLGDRASAVSARLTLASLMATRGDHGGAGEELTVAMQAALDLAMPALQLAAVLTFGRLLVQRQEPAAAGAAFAFVEAHAAASAPVRDEARRAGAALGTAAIKQPAIELPEFAHRIVTEATVAHAPLVALLRGTAGTN